MENSKYKDSYFYLAVTAALVISIWGFRLFRGLWLDETLTYWLIEGGPSEAYSRASQLAGQSPFYYLLEALLPALGFRSEFALRLPSVICAFITLLLIFKIAAHYFGKESGWIAVIIFIVSDGVIFAAVSARPYALAMMFSTAAIWAALNYVRSGKIRPLILSFGFLLAAFYAHYLFALSSTVILAVILGSRDPAIIRRGFYAGVISVPLFIPGLFHLQTLLSRKDELSVPGLPSVLELTFALLPIALISLLLISTLIAAGIKGASLDKNILKNYRSGCGLPMLLLWHFMPPLFLFFAGLALGTGSIFTNRYYLWYSPALAVLLSSLLVAVQPYFVRRIAIALFAALMIAAEPHRPIFTEEWRDAIGSLNSKVSAQDKFLFYSGIVESSSFKFLQDPGLRGYLTAPLVYYGSKGSPTLLPYRLDTENGKEQWQKVIEPFLREQQEFFILGSDTIQVGGVPSSVFITNLLKEHGQFNPALSEAERFRKIWLIKFIKK